MYDGQKDDAVMLDAQKGIQEAIDEIGRRYAPVVARICKASCPTEEWEDVAEDVWVGIMKSLGGFRYRAAVGTWIRRITQLRIATFYRLRERERERHRQCHLDSTLRKRTTPPPKLSVVGESFPEPADARETKYLKILDLMERGYTNRMIGEQLGWHSEKVRATYRRAREYFSVHLEDL